MKDLKIEFNIVESFINRDSIHSYMGTVKSEDGRAHTQRMETTKSTDDTKPKTPWTQNLYRQHGRNKKC